MPSAKRPSRSALVALAEEVSRDTNIPPEVRSRLSWGIRRELEDNRRMSILEEETRAAVWRVVTGLQTGGRDLLTRCRALGELIRGLRALGMLGRAGVIDPRRSRVKPPIRSALTRESPP
jgi:hypothetical protein